MEEHYASLTLSFNVICAPSGLAGKLATQTLEVVACCLGHHQGIDQICSEYRRPDESLDLESFCEEKSVSASMFLAEAMSIQGILQSRYFNTKVIKEL
jgi:hypothetical protein